MTFAGKKLQDIYDSGSARLNELEEASTAKLANKASAHVNERQESEQQSKMEVAAKAAAVEEEIKRRPDLVFVDLQKQTKDNQSIFGFAPDLFHPNNLRYKNWADAFWAKIDKKDL